MERRRGPRRRLLSGLFSVAACLRCSLMAAAASTPGDPQAATWDDSLALLSLQLDPGANRSYLIVPLLHSGLGRRLQLLASGFLAAQDTGRVLVAGWAGAPHCAASLFDLFTPESLDAAGVQPYTGSLAFLAAMVPRYTIQPERDPLQTFLNR